MGVTLCEACRNNVHECDWCGCLTEEDYGDANTTLCEYCRDNAHECDWCGCLVRRGEECSCGRCGIHEYSYTPRPDFRGKGPLYFGIELEMEFEGHDWDGLPDDGYLYAKHDGSLTCGVEIVSHPASWEWLCSEGRAAWQQILDWRLDRGYRSYNTGTCGMHVHMSRDAFTTFHLYKWLQFFYQNPQFILDISRRSAGTLARWASLDGPSATSDLIAKAKDGRGKSRYEAINLNNPHTIEIRIFRGTLHPSGFWRNLEFLRCLYNYTATVDAKGCKGMGPDGLQTYAIKHKKDFPNFVAWFEGR